MKEEKTIFEYLNILTKKHKTKDLIEIITLINDRIIEGGTIWDHFDNNETQFTLLFHSILDIFYLDVDSGDLIECMKLLINIYQNIEIECIRKVVLPLVAWELWKNLTPNRLDSELSKSEEMRSKWESLVSEKKRKNVKNYNVDFIPTLLQKYFSVLESINPDDINEQNLLFCQRVIEFLIDLLSQKSTRRFLHVLIEDVHFYIRSSYTPIHQSQKNHLLSQLLLNFQFVADFEVDDDTGESIDDEIRTNIYYESMIILQRMAFKYYPEELKDLSLCSVHSISTPESLLNAFNVLSDEQLFLFCAKLRLIPDLTKNEKDICNYSYTRENVLHILINKYSRKVSQIDKINSIPILPNEAILWDDNLVPSGHYNKDKVLAMPKLNLQFLTFQDYLLRNFDLFRLESCYEIRQDIVQNIKRMDPRKLPNGNTDFRGFSRFALPISSFKLLEVKKPKLGELHPGRVTGEIILDYSSLGGVVKSEWEDLKEHDVLFLVTIESPNRLVTFIEQEMNDKLPIEQRPKTDEPNRSLWNEETATFLAKEGILHIRGCEIHEVFDESHNVLNEIGGVPDNKRNRAGLKRIFHVLLDPNQYQVDQEDKSRTGVNDLYATFNLVIRRKSEVNNFKAVLETIRDLMNIHSVNKYVPKWLHQIFLGTGNPKSAHYSNMKDRITTFDMLDTFLSKDHIIATHPNQTIKFLSRDRQELPDELIKPPFKVQYADDCVIFTPYTLPYPGPYPKPIRHNQIPFVTTQIEAIKSGMSLGLTLIVGPPGTGKTDVAVQIISNIYHNFPDQRTLLVTHSNHALNDLFTKITEMDIDEKHLLRLGIGEQELETDKDFSRYGRVNATLYKRIDLLKEINRLSESLQIPCDGDHTCESAEYFFIATILPKIEEYKTKLQDLQYKINGSLINEVDKNNGIALIFPFIEFFKSAVEPIITNHYETDIIRCESALKFIRDLFEELKEYRAFELLRGNRQRSDYLLVKQARIIAMTCTHAAIARKRLIDLNFKYDNIIMEEAGQILEVESFIPILLQNKDLGEENRMKRVILIGDHNQLPPIIQNLSFQKNSHLDQSLFSRFVRLGVPTIQLSSQGRARSSIVDLYRWRYPDLTDLLHISENSIFNKCSPGFLYDYQLINVDDYNGKGEKCPSPFFYQNEGEAEYIVTVYEYMRLIGYPANQITILSTYNGQVELLRKLCTERCGNKYGMPKITTVDRYQGQQNDYILLSLVRTERVGHYRDIRRSIVSLSRSRLGLYIFCRDSLFSKCEEIRPVFDLLHKRPSELMLVEKELFGSERALDNYQCSTKTIKNLNEMKSSIESLSI